MELQHQTEMLHQQLLLGPHPGSVLTSGNNTCLLSAMVWQLHLCLAEG